MMALMLRTTIYLFDVCLIALFVGARPRAFRFAKLGGVPQKCLASPLQYPFANLF
jgi:hypothetical protein